MRNETCWVVQLPVQKNRRLLNDKYIEIVDISTYYDEERTDLQTIEPPVDIPRSQIIFYKNKGS